MDSVGQSAPPGSRREEVTEVSPGAPRIRPQRELVTLPTGRWVSWEGACEGRCPLCETGTRLKAVFQHLKGKRGAHPPAGSDGGAGDTDMRRLLAAGRGRRAGACFCSSIRHGCLKQKPFSRPPGARRSQSQRWTLMYRCPISAFNWRPLGQATRERDGECFPRCPASSKGDK